MSASIHGLKVYGVPFSVHTRKVLMAAQLKGIGYEVVPVAPVLPDGLPRDWPRISPTGLIPAIEHGGLSLTDSTAITLYLERLVPEPALLPQDPKEYARVLSLDAWAGTLFQRVVRPLFHELVVGPRLHDRQGDRAIIDGALREARACFTFLEGLDRGRFLVGEHLSIADLAVVSNLIVFHYVGQRIDSRSSPRLSQYFRDRIAEPAFATALERERPFVEQMGLDPALT